MFKGVVEDSTNGADVVTGIRNDKINSSTTEMVVHSNFGEYSIIDRFNEGILVSKIA